MDVGRIIDLTTANPPQPGEDERSYNKRIAAIANASAQATAKKLASDKLRRLYADHKDAVATRDRAQERIDRLTKELGAAEAAAALLMTDDEIAEALS